MSSKVPDYKPLIRVFVVAVILAAFLVFALLPADYFVVNDFGLCLFERFLGIECPGCGTKRALSALLHGQWRAAFDFNPLAYFWVVAGVATIIYNLVVIKCSNYATHQTHC